MRASKAGKIVETTPRLVKATLHKRKKSVKTCKYHEKRNKIVKTSRKSIMKGPV